MKFLLLLILLFLTSSSHAEENINIRQSKLTFLEENEVNRIFESMVTEFKEVISNPFNEDGKCQQCKSSIEYIRNILLKKYGIEGWYKFLTYICKFFLDEKVCYGAIRLQGPVIIDSLIKKIFSPTETCNAVKLCQDKIDYISIEDYAKRVLNDKPKTLPKNKARKSEKIIRALQITDVHLDHKYLEGAIENCGSLWCCRDLPKDNSTTYKLAGKFGSYGKCDSNWETVRAFASETQKLQPDFIMFTGDNTAHNVWEVTQEEIVGNTKAIIDGIENVIGRNIPIYPALGNHESSPVDEFIGNEKEFLKALADIFKPYLPEEAYESYKNYGYYSLLHPNTNLRIISFNCLLCDAFNFNWLYSSKNTKKMFDWLEKVLNESEKSNEKVFIMNHIPNNSGQLTNQCAYRLKILLDRYQNIIEGYFSGHTHKDSIVPVHEYYDKSKPVIINYVASGLTPYGLLNPSFRIYEIDSDTKQVVDYIQYRLNLTKANEELSADNWFISHRGTGLFNVSTLSDINEINKYVVNREYVIKWYSDMITSNIEKDMANIIKYNQCLFDNDIYEKVLPCIGIPKSGIDFLYYGLSKFAGEWKDE